MTKPVPARWTGPLLFLRSRQWPWLPLAVACVVVLLLLVPREAIEVPLREDLLAQLYLALVPAPACLAGLFVARPTATLERRSARVIRARAVWWGTGLLLLAAPVAIALGATDGGLICLRNLALLMGLTTLGGLVVQAEWSWLVALAFVGACVTYGTDELNNLPYSWALLLQPPTDPAAAAISTAIALTGWIAYAQRDLAPPT